MFNHPGAAFSSFTHSEEQVRELQHRAVGPSKLVPQFLGKKHKKKARPFQVWLTCNDLLLHHLFGGIFCFTLLGYCSALFVLVQVKFRNDLCLPRTQQRYALSVFKAY